MSPVRFARLGLLPTLLWAAAAAQGQAWPSKPVTIVLPYAPGGGTDVVARLLAARLSDRLGKPFIVENRAGATGNIAAAFVARSAPDGQTLLLGSAANFSINPNLFKSLPYRPSDLIVAAMVVEYPNVLVTRHGAPFQNVEQLISYARSHPGALNYSTAGIGATGHLSMEMFCLAEGIKLTSVVYKGSGPSLIALLGGEVDLTFDTLAVYGPQINAGKLQPLAVSTDARFPGFNNIPTMSEAGVKGFSAPAWFAIGVVASTPTTLVQQINREFRSVLAEPGVAAVLATNGFTARLDDMRSSQDFVRSESAKWANVIRDANMSAE